MLAIYSTQFCIEFFHNIIIKMMDEFEWENAKQDLEELNMEKFGNNYDKACLHYFDLLRKIELKTLCTKVEIEHMENNYERAKRQAPRDSSQTQKVKQDYNVASPEENHFEAYEHVCKIKNCTRGFDNKTSLAHHMMLIHNTPSVDFTKDKVFLIEYHHDSSRRARH